MHNILITIYFFRRNSPQWAMASSFTRFLDNTRRRITVGRTHPDEWSTRRRDLWQHTTLTTDIHVTGGIRTHNQSTRAAEDPRLRQRGHWGQQLLLLFILNLHVYTRLTRKSLHLPSTGWCTRHQDTTVYSKFTCSFTHNYFMDISVMMVLYRSKHFGMYYFNTNNSDK
jgi:hypothetical protein